MREGGGKECIQASTSWRWMGGYGAGTRLLETERVNGTWNLAPQSCRMYPGSYSSSPTSSSLSDHALTHTETNEKEGSDAHTKHESLVEALLMPHPVFSLLITRARPSSIPLLPACPVCRLTARPPRAPSAGALRWRPS